MKTLSAQETLLYMVQRLTAYLEELREARAEGEDFAYGEKTAYTECLELIQLWEGAKENGLDYEIEKKYPL